jgi:hypothetical protein
MRPSTPELPRLRRPVCPHCGNALEPVRANSWIETGAGVLAILALVLVLLPLGIMLWKSCANFLTGNNSHSILFQPLEDWTRY